MQSLGALLVFLLIITIGLSVLLTLVFNVVGRGRVAVNLFPALIAACLGVWLLEEARIPRPELGGLGFAIGGIFCFIACAASLVTTAVLWVRRTMAATRQPKRGPQTAPPGSTQRKEMMSDEPADDGRQ